MKIPWDVKPIGGGRLLITERDSGHLILWQNGDKRLVAFPSNSVWSSNETGLMGLEIDPDFASNGRFYTCQGGFTGGGGHEVHVIAWRLNAAATKATFQQELVGGFPTTTGRHGGCRLLILRSGALLVGTGDAAQGTNPQNQRSLGGKTLRLDRLTGAPWPFNPWPNAKSVNRRYVYTYGHRNVQGLAFDDRGRLWAAEFGQNTWDELNLITAGGNYGWPEVEGQVARDGFVEPERVWHTQDASPSGIAFWRGSIWMAGLRGERLWQIPLTDSATNPTGEPVAQLTDVYGRLRTVQVAPDGSLWVSTSNTDGRGDVRDGDDRILRLEFAA